MDDGIIGTSNLNANTIPAHDASEEDGTGAATTESESVIETWGLCKRYGDFDALDDCSVRVLRGEIFGLLGPNGAGKTTLIRLLLGLLRPSAGRCEVDGFSPGADGVALRERVSYLPGDARLPRHMRGSSVINFFSEMHPRGDRQRSLQIADQLELDMRRHVAFMSTGMRQKLALAVVLGTRAPVMILDEPTANLDPSVRAKVLDLVVESRNLGSTIVLSSHVLSEIEEVCDRVAFLRGGRLARELTMSDLFQRHRITADRPERAIDVPDELANAVRMIHDSEGKESEGALDARRIEMEVSGDLAPLFVWLDTLRLKRVRIEPLGLRAVYDSVHQSRESKQ